jgi:hypothetical protein
VKLNGGDESGWSDVSDAAGKMFNVWVDGHELEWAREAWGYLHPAGLEGEETSLKVTAAKLHLVTLARIYQEFCGLAWEENPETPVDYLAEDLDMDSVALGILAAASTDSEYFRMRLKIMNSEKRRYLLSPMARGGKSLSNSKPHTAAMSRFTRVFGIRDQIPTVSTQTKNSNRLWVPAGRCNMS